MSDIKRIDDDDLNKAAGGSLLDDCFYEFTDFDNLEACKALIGKTIIYDTERFGRGNGTVVEVISNRKNALVLDNGTTLVLGLDRINVKVLKHLDYSIDQNMM